MPQRLNFAFKKPIVVFTFPGMYLVYKINEFKRQLQEQNRREITERELAHLNHKIDKLLVKLEEHEPEMAKSRDEECAICINARATMQTFPCGHRVVCRKCFVKTIQIAVSQRILPLRCVVCRARILRIKQTTSGGTPVPPSRRAAMLMTSREALQNGQDAPMAAVLSGSQGFFAPAVNPVKLKPTSFKNMKYKVAVSPSPKNTSTNKNNGDQGPPAEEKLPLIRHKKPLKVLNVVPDRSPVQWAEARSKHSVVIRAPKHRRRHQVHVSTPAQLFPIEEHDEQETLEIKGQIHNLDISEDTSETCPLTGHGRHASRGRLSAFQHLRSRSPLKVFRSIAK
ncbi:uncharacterized protein LOC111086734 [Limulus polyphemus]|uniref:Uncharacterized protein LOC111086734 n=1 Tax=Limulus polyphemus TaxID=6850 RepID=A0ABM1SS84_LIMPO|nr:uncharacterized protein LOC111086734 [Limulus polyphemus]